MNRVFLVVPFLLLCAMLSGGCGGSSFGQRADSLYLINDQSEIYYDLKRPEQKYFLPYVLSEVSGLTWVRDNTVACVEDEGGKVYLYDMSKREIVQAVRFAKPGDFEGVEIIGNHIYTMKSSGDLYHFDLDERRELIGEKVETVLTSKNDTEGLGYDPETHSLLLACKEDGDTKDYNAKGKAIYAFDLEKQKLKKKARFEIRMKDLKAFFEANKPNDYEEKKIKFEPSGIAFHPIEKTFYILASVGKLLVVLNRDGSIKATYPIAPRILNQPEGICFAPNGDLYISSEGEGDKGYILKFPMKTRG